MLFNSIEFLIFLPIVVLTYYLISHKFRWVFLLSASYYFYMCWKPEYVLLIILSTIIDYLAGIQMGKSSSKHTKKVFLILSLFVNLGLLFAFKYFNFFSQSTRLLLSRYNIFFNEPVFNVLLPIGISFYTFQTLSYTIDIYRGIRKPEKHLGIFALYVSFFPQLVAGPIERSTSLMPQFYEKHSFDYNLVTSGLRLILWGFFKKVVIADRLSVIVDQVYGRPSVYTGLPIIIATYSFAIQIYCDFSGYSDIAIGSARLFGFRLMKNFNIPYFSSSIKEFWKRWHISLTSWFRDYLYFPLGGNKTTILKHMFNVLVVFFISGLWHGANWTFVLWGISHGILFIIFLKIRGLLNYIKSYLDRYLFIQKIWKITAILLTFHTVAFLWIFFRAESVSDAFYIICHAFPSFGNSIDNSMLKTIWVQVKNLGLNKFEMCIGAFSIICMFTIEYLMMFRKNSLRITHMPIWARWGCYMSLIIYIFMFGYFNKVPFVYFQF